MNEVIQTLVKELQRLSLDSPLLANADGEFLYSSIETLRDGELYLLGTNPGGRNTGAATLQACFAELPTKKTNHYLDDQWQQAKGNPFPAHQSRLSKRLCKLIEQLDRGYTLRDVCASNLIFVRSQNLKGPEMDQFQALAEACWPLHKKIIEAVQPRVLLVFGNSEGKDARSAYQYLLSTLTPKDIPQELPLSGNRKLKWFKAEVNKHPVIVVGIPHLSRFEPHSDAIRKIKELLG